MKIAVLGGSGFLGYYLEKQIINKFSYKIFDKKKPLSNSEFVFFDITDSTNLDEFDDVDIIINLAAIHRDDVKPKNLYEKVNIEGSKNICEIAKLKGINKIIFVSSVAIYGFSTQSIDENSPKNYFNEYGRTKFFAEKVYIEWQKEQEKERFLTIIRPTVIFGEGNRGNVFNLFNQINSGRFFMIGDGKNIKSMAYVKNVAAFIEFCLSFKSNLSIMNYADKPDLNMESLVKKTRNILFNKNNVGKRLPKSFAMVFGYVAEIVSSVLNISFPISRIRVKKFLNTTQFSSLHQMNDFKAPYSLDDAIKNTLNYEFLDKNDKKISFNAD